MVALVVCSGLGRVFCNTEPAFCINSSKEVVLLSCSTVMVIGLLLSLIRGDDCLDRAFVERDTFLPFAFRNF